MASKVMEEFLRKASPEAKSALEQARQQMQQSGAQLNQDVPAAPTTTNPMQRPDVQQIGQDLRQSGAQLSQDTYGPQTPARIGEARPHAEIPKYMNEQRPPVQSEKRPNAVDQALASPEKATERTPEKQKSQDMER